MRQSLIVKAIDGHNYWGEGSKKKYLRHQTKKLESLVFYGPCNSLNSLETKPGISVVFASFWKWSLSPVRFLQDIGPRNRSTLLFRQHLQHFGVRIFDFRWLL
jgi:hypothetical protein